MAHTYRIVLRKLTLGAATATLAVAGTAGPAGAQKPDGGTDGGTLLCSPDSPICVAPVINLGSADGGKRHGALALGPLASGQAGRRRAVAEDGRTAPMLTPKVIETKRGSAHAMAAPIGLGSAVKR